VPNTDLLLFNKRFKIFLKIKYKRTRSKIIFIFRSKKTEIFEYHGNFVFTIFELTTKFKVKSNKRKKI